MRSYRLYTHIYECERQLTQAFSQLQAEDLPGFSSWEVMWQHVQKHMLNLVPVHQAEAWGAAWGEYVGEMIENVQFLIVNLRKARDFDDVYQTIVAVTRFFTKKGFGQSILDLYKYVTAESEVQSFDFNDLRSMMDNYEAVKTSPLIIKVQKLCSLGLASCLLQSVGVTAKVADIVKVYGEACVQILANVDFMATLLDIVVFMVERLSQCWHLKSFSPFFHSSKTYGKWATSAYTIIEQSQLMHNPEANGLTYHGFLDSLEQCIEEGLEIQKFAKAADKRDVVLNVLSKLRIVRGEILTRRAAGQERRAPFSVLVCGGSGIGKSGFVKTLLSHYGKMFHLPEGSEFLFTRSFGDKFWSGFRTQMWGINLDDIAYVNPNKGTEDQSLSELLQIVNNVAFCPNQADLEDKGKTPVRAEIVVATTNTEHLNASTWFSNPVAVRRRLPFIIELTPKKEFARDDAAAMLDPAKVPMSDPGCYDDLWHIKLSRVVVVNTDDNRNQDVQVLPLQTYTNIYEFYAALSGIIREFRAQQEQATASMENLRTVNLCAMCDLPVKHCKCAMLQAGDVDLNEGYTYKSVALGVLAGVALGGVAYTQKIAPSVDWSSISRFTSSAKAHLATYTREFLVQYMKDLGSNIVGEVLGNRKLQMVLAGLGLLTSGYVAYRTLQSMCTPEPQSKDSILSRFGTRPVSTHDENENFYHQKDDYRAKMSVTEQTKSWRSLEWTAICAKLTNSVVAIRTTRQVDGKTLVREGKAVCVGGRLYVTDNHILPDVECILDVTRELHTSGLTTNVRRVLDPGTIKRYPKKELAFFQLLDSFDCKDVSPFFGAADFRTTTSGAIIGRSQVGEAEVMQLNKVTNIGSQHVTQLGDVTLDLWEYNTPKSSAVGMCGSLVVVRSPSGPVIVGLHLLGRNTLCHAVRVSSEDITAAREHFFPTFSPSSPMLESRDRSVGVTPLHPKSVFRFIGHGAGRVFGQLTLPRVQPKTSVCNTIFHDVAVREGFVVRCGAPVMKGKRLWRQAVLPIVEQEFQFRESVVAECARAYVDEVYTGLSVSDRKELAQPLDLASSINGIPGRKYIDSINRSSSAGFPWMRTKKSVCVSIPSDDTWQDPIDVNDEVKERMETMFARYLDSELVHPVFTAHAKDEVLPLRKVLAEKTRVMNGAPLDWSLLVRMVYLPVVRVIQNNKFLFEAMPGAVAQSREWDDIYHHITQFGEERMIAGDYKEYDKRMDSTFILWAFSCLIDITKRCGANEDTIRVMWGVAYDVSSSYCNFDGDLVQFMGSNPSGHPLTVVINCVVNSLYMRYCYHELNPEREVYSFRSNIALITYGDDNVAGSAVDWFNHTSVSQMLSSVGVIYTMADKEAESVPFLHVDQISFLKRGWRYEPDVDARVCPIEHATLDKMMTAWVPSDTLGDFAQGEQIIQNVGVEYFWYGRQVFEEKQVLLRKIFSETIPEEYLTKKTFPTWESLVIRWKVSSGQMDPPLDEEGRVA